MTYRWVDCRPPHDNLINEFMVKTTSGCLHGEEVKTKRVRPKSKSNLTILKQIKS